MTISRVVVLDPGKTTGVVDWTAGHHAEPPTVTWAELDFKGTCDKLLSIAAESVSTGNLDIIIICESFIITQQTAKNTQAPWSLELIGVARMISELYLGKPLILQQPSQAKRFSSDNRLKRMGWFWKGKGHANDAARHLLLFTATRGLLPQEVLQEFAEMP